eukprot:TRINITY_DN35398_c0_g1_i1.p1 TRINITY_DN35398_c0_g1~~TRINITY_DN35398_c0_g1_i1.p1  ORF type:complete len:551 (+),score=87.10 TRINITY_DN35398_c0_g1_i1:166-1818(+)
MQAGLVQEDSQAHTPVSHRSAAKQVGTPGTPHLEPKSANSATTAATPDVCRPRAVRAFPGFSEGAGLPGSTGASDEAASEQELRALLGGGSADVCLPNGKSSHKFASAGERPQQSDNRPLSSVSTSAGPTPSPDDRSSPHSASPMAEGNSERFAAKRSDNKGKGKDSSKGNAAGNLDPAQVGPSQARKIFVGGIPQDMQQDELFKIFAEYGQVKKAWLQRYRDGNGKGKATAPGNNHRGFGFVIFQDSTVVDQLLRNGDSHFLTLPSGRRLEIKRAVSSSDITNSSTSAESPPRNLFKGQPGKGSSMQQQGSFAGPARLSSNNAVGLQQQHPVPLFPEGMCGGQHHLGGLHPAAAHGCLQGDPRGNSIHSHAASPAPHPGMVMSQSHVPWPTTGRDMPMPPQCMSPPPQGTQQVFPAVGTPIAAPTAIRAPAGGILLPGHGQCAYSAAPLPNNGMGWIPANSQTPPPMLIPSVGSPVPMQCNNDASQPQMQPLYSNTWTAHWAPVPNSPTPPPQSQQMPQQMPQQQFPHHSQVAAWQHQGQQHAQFGVPQ